MPKYVPIPHPKIRCVDSDLIRLHWNRGTRGNNSINADFIIPDSNVNALRVGFESVHVLRLLDEMPISTENEETLNQGLIADGFAYVVEDAAFWKQQSSALKAAVPGLKHYRFITGWTCMDIISKDGPQFSIVRRDANRRDKGEAIS